MIQQFPGFQHPPIAYIITRMGGNKTCVILNPNASKGRGARSRERILDAFLSRGEDVDILVTGGAGQAERMAFDACGRGYGRIVVAGGDGTVNEVVNGVMKSGASVSMGIIPIGRGNDFAWIAGIPHDIDKAVSLIVQGRARRIDVGHLVGGRFPEGRYFLNGTGFGFEPSINFKAGEYRHLNGMPSYIVAFFHCLLHLPRPYDLTVTIDGSTMHLKSQQVSVCNGRRMGSAFILAPHAKLDDGLLDIVYSNRPVFRRQVVPMVLSFLRGTQLETCSFMEERRGRHVLVESARADMQIHTDGELVSHEAKICSIGLIAGGLSLFCGCPPMP